MSKPKGTLMSPTQKPAVVLLSGGLDSTTVLALAKQQGFLIHALTFQYGQKHNDELEAAHRVAEAFQVHEHRVAQIDLGLFGGSALTDHSLEVPKQRSLEEMEKQIPITYVPARNTIFLSFALAWADVIGACDLFIGVNALDYSGYPDCRPEFIKAYEKMANLGTRIGSEGQTIQIHTPLIHLTKGEIVKTGLDLGVDYGLTLTCYDPKDSISCGQCDACLLRKKGFAENGVSDPIRYRNELS